MNLAQHYYISNLREAYTTKTADLQITVTDLPPMSESTTKLPPRTDRKHTHQ